MGLGDMQIPVLYEPFAGHGPIGARQQRTA